MKFVLNKSKRTDSLGFGMPLLDAANKITMTSTKYGHQILWNEMCVCERGSDRYIAKCVKRHAHTHTHTNSNRAKSLTPTTIIFTRKHSQASENYFCLNMTIHVGCFILVQHKTQYNKVNGNLAREMK